MDLNGLLRRAVELGASDIHLKIGKPPVLRRDGSLGEMEEADRGGGEGRSRTGERVNEAEHRGG